MGFWWMALGAFIFGCGVVSGAALIIYAIDREVTDE